MQHFQTVFDGGTLSSGLFEKQGRGGVVDQIVAKVLLRDEFGIRPRRDFTIGEHAQWCCVDYDGDFVRF